MTISHDLLRLKLAESLAADPPALTRRDVVLPGISGKAFDGRGNYTLGIREQLIFPEIDFNKVDKTRGMNISIVTTAINDDQARSLLKGLGMPFRQ